MGKLVLMEDDLHLQRLMEYALQTSGHQVLVAADGEAGMALVRQHRPDLILLDVLMPVRGGLEVLSELQSDPALAQIPVLIVTASAQRAEIEHALTVGATAYVIKPFRLDELRDRVEALLSQHTTV